MRIFNSIKVSLLVASLAVFLTGPAALFAKTSSAKQLEKGIKLYNENNHYDAMDYFIDVLVNGTRAEANIANDYINRIHNGMGGIQEPVEVDVNFQEGQPRRLQPAAQPAVLESDQEEPIVGEVDSAGLPYTAAQDASAMSEQDAAVSAAQRDGNLPPVQQAASESADVLSVLSVQPDGDIAALEARIAAYRLAVDRETGERPALEADSDMPLTASQEAELLLAEQAALEQEALGQTVPAAAETPASAPAKTETESSSTYADLTSPSAIKARQLYTSQKLESMKQAAIAKLKRAKGVRIYFRNDLPDAIDIDSEVLFDGYKFRTEALPILDEVYTLMALTQGAGYIILPPGSYTDNITLAGIRQAMALNSYLVHKGLSSGKLSYNMGLFDQEPPAKFANLDGISIVFDFESDLPASMPQAASVSKQPMLSMAVVPVSNTIDPAAGEAFVVDFSVIETAEILDNWVFQVVQHAANGGYYVVRQLEGYSPVYHQILWNGRKGVIGPALACGTYTLALTATDVMGGKRTVRRQINVACTLPQETETSSDGQTEGRDSDLNYKTPRLWNKPERFMKEMPAPAPAAEPDIVDPFAATAPSTEAANAYAMQQAGVTDPYAAYGAQGVNNPYAQPAQGVSDPYAQPAQGVSNPYAAPAAPQTYTQSYTQPQQQPAQGVTNPYDMPYESYGG